MNNIRFAIILNLVLLLLNSCDQSSTASGKEQIADKSPEKKTQALLLTQPFDYDHTDKNKIVGPYKKNRNINVPLDLASQNKWIKFEGPVLENDLVAYRYYADQRHRFDVFGKTVSDLVMDTVSWDYHNIMNWGSDILKVGNSLGIGSPAIWYRDSLYTFSNYDKKTIEIIEDGSNKSTIRTKFQNLTIDSKAFNLIQDWSLESGSSWSEITLKIESESLPEGMHFASGFVKHLPLIDQSKNGDVFSAYNWGKQSFHDQNMGMAILSDSKYQVQLVKDSLSHAFVFTEAPKEIRYKFTCIWEKDNNKILNSNDFKNYVLKSKI